MIDIIASLEDSRNCTMITGNRIDKVLGAEFNLSYMVNAPEIDRIWLTPQFLPHFDFTHMIDFRLLYQLLQFKCNMLGFEILFQTSGNTEQQKCRPVNLLVA